MKTWIAIMLCICAAVIFSDAYALSKVEPVASPTPAPVPKDNKMHIINNQKVELGTVDPTTGKVELAPGQTWEDLVRTAVSVAEVRRVQHEAFKAEVLSAACPQLKKKIEKLK